jgi:hypothetical protein
MRNRTRPLALLLAAALLTACSSDGMVQPLPMPEPEPGPAPGPTVTALQIDFNYVEVIRDCDGIEGDGDFTFVVVASPSFGGASTVLNRSETLGPGGRTAAIGRRTWQTEATSGKQLTVELRASERDTDIFGRRYNDSRMDNIARTLAHTFNGKSWSNLGPKTITVGSGDCQVRLHYTATQTK